MKRMLNKYTHFFMLTVPILFVYTQLNTAYNVYKLYLRKLLKTATSLQPSNSITVTKFTIISHLYQSTAFWIRIEYRYVYMFLWTSLMPFMQIFGSVNTYRGYSREYMTKVSLCGAITSI
jgi:hypothetical protein